MNTIHVGVQSSKQNAKAEIITAVLLLHICKQPDTDLGKLRIDLVKGLPQLFSVLQQDDTGTVNGISQVKKDYRGKAEEMVQLFYYCQTPWLMDQHLPRYMAIHNETSTCTTVQSVTTGSISIV